MTPKLVRDGVPRSISGVGKTVHIVNPFVENKEQYDQLRLYWFDQKLQEEVDEFKKSHDAMELVDIYEVLHSLWKLCNPDADISLEKAAAIKRETLGGFDKFTILCSVKEYRR